MAKALGIARFWYEGNSFSPLMTELEHFHKEEWLSGNQILEKYKNVATEMGGAVAFAEEHPDWEVHFLHCCAAPPGGPLSDQAFAKIKLQLLQDMKSRKWDAFYLSLHGAAVTLNNSAPDLELLKEAREILGYTPFGVTFDLHANLSPEMIDLADIAVGYKTYPHIDMAETAKKALRLLDEYCSGKPIFKAFAKIPIILPSFNMRTDDGPMADILAKGKALNCMDLSLFGGFAYADSPFFGPSILASASSQEFADKAVETMKKEWTRQIDRFFISLPGPEEALGNIKPMEKPVALLDPADNPLSGGIGDTNSLFAALLKNPPAMPAVFAFFYDPMLVDRTHRIGLGATINISLGGRIAPMFGAPIEVEARILKLTDGHFRNEGPMWRGAAVKLGRTALLEVQGIKVIITETCQAPNDPAYFKLHGIDLSKIGLLCVKAKNHFRAAFRHLTSTMIDVDCPGPAALNIAHLPYRHATLGKTRNRGHYAR